MVFYDDKVVRYPYDVAIAKALLAGLGFVPGPDGILKDKAGHTLEFTLTTNSENNQRVSMCTVIQESLKQIGVKVNLAPQQFNSLVEKLNSSFDWEAVVLGLDRRRRALQQQITVDHDGHPARLESATEIVRQHRGRADVDKLFAEAGQDRR